MPNLKTTILPLEEPSDKAKTEECFAFCILQMGRNQTVTEYLIGAEKRITALTNAKETLRD